MSPGFYDAAVFQNERLIGSRHGVEPVGDNDRGPSVRQAAERRLDRGFVLGIGVCGGLVQHEHGRILQNRARNGDALGFAAGEVAVGRSDDGVVSLGERKDPLVNLRGLRGFDHLVVRRIGAGELDVVADAER